MNKFLFKQIDNIGLVLFRVVFGALIATEAFGAMLTGWLQRTLVEPQFTFNFIGLEFLQPLPGNLMYYYFALMGIFGLGVMLGYKYRFSMFCYALMWSCVYLMQKTSYNNHYYLMMLLCWIMVVLPANRWFSLDAKINPLLKSPSMPRWCILILILQVWIVYTFASVAKFYPEWLDASTTGILMHRKDNIWLIGGLLQEKWVHYAIAYVGIIFDLSIVPLLLFRKTRVVGFGISVLFHLFNSFVFLIGIFPYMSIAFALFFFSPQILKKRFLPKKQLYTAEEVIMPKLKPLLITVFSIYFIFQIGLPLRHWFFKGDVLWTEEGHRLSWRMMLRSKTGTLSVRIKDKKTNQFEIYNYQQLVTDKQANSLKSKPDMLWQLAQRIHKIEAERGRDVGVYMNSMVRVNTSNYYQFIDPKVDLAAEEWHHFKHNDWILLPEKFDEKE